MRNSTIGEQYDAIAEWWASHHRKSTYGVSAVEKALSFAKLGGQALDVGCGSGGRLASLLERHGFSLTGIDSSQKMIDLARKGHPKGNFTAMDVQDWTSDIKFDFILAWDSLFHLPLNDQQPVLSTLCSALAEGGVLIYSFGDAVGAHSDEWRGQIFHYSSMGVTRNIEILHENGLSLRHLELDQFPEKHVYAIAQRMRD